MKVVQINSVCGVGSTGRIAVDISKILDKHNIENYIFYSAGSSSLTNARKFNHKLLGKFNALLSRICGNYGFYPSWTTKKLIKMLQEVKPNVVHLHNIHSHDIDLTTLFTYLKKCQIKVIWTFHDCWAFTGYCTYFEKDKCFLWQTKCASCPQRKTYSWFLDQSSQNWQSKKELFCGLKDFTIVTPSQWLADYVKKSFLQEYSIKVINNGIELDNFQSMKTNLKERLDLQDKKIILGIFNCLDDRKGGRFLINLASKLATDTQLVILSLQTQEQLAKNITILPRTNSSQELAEIYSMADVYVNPTLEDNFPTVNLEALACGTPVITFKTGGSPEAIDEETGIVVEQGNEEELLKAVTEVLTHGKAFYSQACQDRAKHCYNKKFCFSQYIDLYRG